MINETIFEKDGKQATIFLPKDQIEDETIKQLSQIITNESVSNIKLMPDSHVGHGCIVGFTAQIDIDKINPNFIGGDIFCGMLTYPLFDKKLNYYKIEEKVRHIIPMGNDNATGCHQVIPIEMSYLETHLSEANKTLQQFYEINKLKIDLIREKTGLNLETPTINYSFFEQVCKKINIKVDSCLKSLGTLGGGNHFIEINKDETGGTHFLTIHSGSRNFGMKLFHHHCMYVDSKTKCLLNDKSLEYVNDMILAQELAKMNKHIMLRLILREIGVIFCPELLIESPHNYIDFQRMILRKGAVSAEKDKTCIVALNMRDGILLCSGIGNPNWNYSCAHGCGRQMSRNEAKRSLSLKTFKKSMKDVVSNSVNKETLDEAPQAYKDYNMIQDIIHEKTVIVNKHLLPVINWKG